MSNFDVYALPYIPQALLDINGAPAFKFETADHKVFDHVDYNASFAGPAFRIRYPPPLLYRTGTRQEIKEESFWASPGVLHSSNYLHYFQSLLEDEMVAQTQQNDERGLFQVQTLPEGPFFKLEVPGLREDIPMILPGDIVELRPLLMDPYTRQLLLSAGNIQTSNALGNLPGFTGYVYCARVEATLRAQENLVLKIDGPQPAEYTFFNVTFPLQHYRYDIYRYTLTRILDQLQKPKATWEQSMLFPQKTDGKMQVRLNEARFKCSFHDERLNYEQKRAVDSICQNDYGTMPFLISGPPGTGKTKTLVETVLQLLKYDSQECILVCAPSDSAADTLVRRLHPSLDVGQLLRLNSPKRNFPEVPGDILPRCYNDERNLFVLPPFEILMQCRVVVTTCRDTEMLIKAGLTNQDLWYLERKMASLIHPSRSAVEPYRLHWSALCVDEAAQATEPEVLAALCVVASPTSTASDSLNAVPQIIMAGDEHQLGPKTASHSEPLETSLFSRLWARPVYADHPLARQKARSGVKMLTREMLPIMRPPFANLIRNYRSHPAILAVPSFLTYYDTLLSEAFDTESLTAWDGWQGQNMPVLFVPNAGSDEIESDGGGWYNNAEVNIAWSLAVRLAASGLIDPKDICIMSPFSAQVRRLRLAARVRNLPTLNIGPTEAFQGLESRLVIICTTRSHARFVQEDVQLSRGLIHQPRRLNMALTRAKQGLIVIGNPETLRQDEHWSAWMSFCERNGLVDKAGLERHGGIPLHANHQPSRYHINGDHHPITRLEKELLLQRTTDLDKNLQNRNFGRSVGNVEEEARYAQGLAIEELLGELDLEEEEFADSDEEERTENDVIDGAILQ